MRDMAASHNAEFVQRAKLGDKAAFNKLVESWYKRIYNFCYKYFNDHDQASESAQKTFIKMFDRIGQLDDVSKFKPWLYIVALNICREESRKKSRVAGLFVQQSDEVEDGLTQAGGQQPGVAMETQELSDIVGSVLQCLPEEQRSVVVMKEYEGMKFREIAEVLNLSENTVKSRLYYGLKAMKKKLESNNAFKESYGYGK